MWQDADRAPGQVKGKNNRSSTIFPDLLISTKNRRASYLLWIPIVLIILNNLLRLVMVPRASLGYEGQIMSMIMVCP